MSSQKNPLQQALEGMTHKEQLYVKQTLAIIREELAKIPTVEERGEYLRKYIEMYSAKSVLQIQKYAGLKPGGVVDMKTFVENDEFLGQKGELYPRVLETCIELDTGKYSEAVLTGAIGVGKSTIAVISQARQVYILSRYTNPQFLFGLQRSSKIIFVFQNITATLAKEVDYEKFRAMVEDSPYFGSEYHYRTEITSEFQFENRVTVKPISGIATASIGQDVFGGAIDELNFMDVVEKSKQSIDGGTYDQAMELYNAIAYRRQSRFAQGGSVPGLLCLVSSKRYPGQFTDVKEEEAKEQIRRTGSTNIFIYDHPAWEILPRHKFSATTFPVFIGDDARQPRVLEKDEKVPSKDAELVMHVPDNWRELFDLDIMRGLRDVCGVSTMATHPYMPNREAISKCFGKYESCLSDVRHDMVAEPKLKILVGKIKNPEIPRFIHIDLGLTSDSAGMACGHVPGFVQMARYEGVYERMPLVRMDFTLEVACPKGGEINYEKIRRLIYALRDQGVNVMWVTLDSFQSTDTLQILANKNIMVGKQSMDTDTLAYDFTKSAFHDGRVELGNHEKLKKELFSLERDPKTGKIDHPPNGSKDISDALAGVVYGLTTRNYVWAYHGYNPADIPQSIKNIVISKTESDEKRTERIRAGAA